MDSIAKPFWVGIDVSKDKIDVAVCYQEKAHADPRTLAVKTFDHSADGTAAFLRWVRSHEGTCAGLVAESTGIYSRLLAIAIRESDELTDAIPALSIVNPQQIKGTARALGQRDKSDTTDARVIAIHGAQRRPGPTPERAGPLEQLRALYQLREQYVRQRTATNNRVETVLDERCRRLLKKDLRHLAGQIAAVEKLIAELIESEPELARDSKLLRSIPGVGPVLAVMALAELGDLRTWSRRQIVAFAGLYPREHSSGKSVRAKPRLAKGGGGLIRKTLYMPALGLLARDYGYNRKILEKQRTTRTERGKFYLGHAMRKLLLVMRAVVVSGQKFDPAKAC